MAKIVILMARGASGKTRTINKIGEKLDLTKYDTRDKGGYPSFVTWAGQAQEIFMKTSSIQEEAASRIRDVFAQTGSPQEKHNAVLEKVLEEVQQWIDFLSDKPNAIAIIPFTLRNGAAMRDLILQPLGIFRSSGNDVKLVYLKKSNIKQRGIVESVVNEARPDHVIKSVKDEEERQADELITYLSLRPIRQIRAVPLAEFFG